MMGEIWRIARRMMGGAVMAGALGLAAMGAGQAQAQGGAAGQITVTGEGAVMVAPDMAVLTLGVTTGAPTAAQAMADNSTAMQAVLARLQGAGIAPRDLQSTGLSLNPNWASDANGQNPQITGYVASNNLNVQVRDLGILGGVLDAAVQDGANTLNSLAFQIADPAPLQAQARLQAIADARTKAEAMATAAGVALGPILSIQETGSDYPTPMLARAAKADMAVPIAAGEVGTTARVTIVYQLAQ
jgi:uncharacterized protein